MLEAIQDAASAAYAKLGRSLSTLVLIGLALWFAFKVLQQVSSMTKQDALPFLTELFRGSFKVVIAFLLLRNSALIYTLLLNPLLKAGFDLGVNFLHMTGNDVLKGCLAAEQFELSNTHGVISPEIYTNLLCFIESVQYELSTTQAIGSSLMCVSRNAAAGNLEVMGATVAKNVLPDIMMMIQGFLVWLIAFILSISFAFYLIDATIQLGIFGVVLPFLILCWPFKITGSYFKTGLGIFINSWFIYVFMGIVTNITLTLIGEGMTGGKGGLGEIIEALNGNDVQALKDVTALDGTGFLIMLACCIFGIKLMMKVTEIAGQFGGGGLGLGIGARLGGLAASGATNTAKYAGGKVTKWGKEAYNAQIFGEEGNEHSLKSSVDKVKHAIARPIGKAGTKMARFTGQATEAIANATTKRGKALYNVAKKGGKKVSKASATALKSVFKRLNKRRKPSA